MKIKFTDIVKYFEGIARKNKQILHSDTEKHFFRLELDELLVGLKSVVNYPALNLEAYDYDLLDANSDNVIKQRHLAFSVFDHLENTDDFDRMHEIWDQCENICDDIISKIKNDKRDITIGVVKDFDLNTVKGRPFSNEIDNIFGIRVMLDMGSGINIDYDATKWV